ncbi:MAG TPA: ceramidase domain-containing protein [Candidatus Saccharibacteria bacterium]|nr:ceramidase domain-containing protein [Candidatus Saccharibacteria bacterium]
MQALFGPPTVTYCEEAGDSFIRRPWYALSNLAFVIAAYVIYKTEQTPLARQFAVITLLVGVLSFIYDASYTYLSQLFDLSGMLLFISFLLWLNLKSLAPERTILPSLILTSIGAIAVIICFGSYTGNIVFGIYILGVIFTEWLLLKKKVHQHGRTWVLTVLLFATGFAIWLLDASKLVCFDFGLLNGRSIFHYVSAFVMYRMFMFYRVQAILDTRQ